MLASASKRHSQLNFLPYIGTVVNAPFGRIPTRLFASDPSVDTFKREQEMLGYQFERNLSDNVTFRQNARFAHVDVTLSTLCLASAISTRSRHGHYRAATSSP